MSILAPPLQSRILFLPIYVGSLYYHYVAILRYNFQLGSMIGFITPFDNMRYIAGLDRNVLFHIPMKAKIDVDMLKKNVSLTLKPGSDRSVRMMHLSMRPYTSIHDIFSMRPVLEESSTKVIHVRPTRQVRNSYVASFLGIKLNEITNTVTHESIGF
jgi:hypothetical protein